MAKIVRLLAMKNTENIRNLWETARVTLYRRGHVNLMYIKVLRIKGKVEGKRDKMGQGPRENPVILKKNIWDIDT